MPQETVELIFCPFCGGTEDGLIIQYNHKEEWVQCECGACGPPKPVSKDGIDCKIAWNTRTKKTSCDLCDNGITEFITHEVKNG